MRLMKFEWLGVAVLGGLLAFSSSATAQDKKDEKPAVPPPATPAAPAVRPAPLSGADLRTRRVEARLNMMGRTLSLTDEQKSKIKPILEEQFKKYEELQQDKAMPIEERRKKLKEIGDASSAKIKPILTAEQAQKMDAPRAGLQRPTPGAGPAPAAPAAPNPSK